MSTNAEITPQVSLDVTGVACPGPLLSAKRMVDDLENGQVLLLISDCSGTAADLKSWSKQTGNPILRVDELDENKRGYYLQKGDPWTPNVTLDMKQARCPGPVVEAAKILKGMSDGEVLKLLSSCNSAPADVDSWLNATHHKLLGQIQNAEGVYIFYIRK